MSSDYGRELLRNGLIDARSGNKESARRYFDRAAHISSDHDVIAEAWFGLSQVTDDKVEKRKALENCLAHNLGHLLARRELAILDGKLKADEIIDPDHISPAPEGLHTASTERFMCPKCGGRMSFAPDGQSLICEYCSRNQNLNAQLGSAEEKDFIVAMSTARGHRKPLDQQVIYCEGCGSEFILPPNQISSTCAYCGSPHVVDWKSEEELLAPDGIIPHAFDQKHATQRLVEWVKKYKIKPEKRVELPRATYLPLWTFHLAGMIDYVGETVDDSEFQLNGRRKIKKVRVKGSYPVQIYDMPIPALRKMSIVFLKLVPTFVLNTMQPYDPRYLASWPARVYDVPLAEASLNARAKAMSQYKRELPDSLAPMQILSTSSAKMTVESFRLTLLPVWMTEIFFEGQEHLLMVNGENGVVQSDFSGRPGGVMKYLSDLLDG